MIKLLFNLFKPQFLKLAFCEQGKPKDLSSFEFAFIDTEGNRYFRPIDLTNSFSQLRLSKLTELAQELESAITGNELRRFLISLLELYNSEDKHRHTKIGAILQEMSERDSNILREDIIIELISAFNIREDESLTIFDEDIHQQKITQLTKDIQAGGGLYDFFQLSGLKTFIPFLDMPQKELEAYITQSKAKIEASKKRLKPLMSEPKKATTG